MSVAAASSAVGTQPTQEQIRLAQLIEDKKHDQPEVQEIVRKVLDVVTNSNQEDALLALFDCDYDYEKAVALLIEKGHEVASEWRTATNHKITKKQQHKTTSTKNGHGEEPDENGHQRGNDGYSYRGKSRGGRSRHQQQQQQPNGGDSQNNHNHQQQDHYVPQQRQRGESGHRGRYRGGSRGGQRTNDRNYQQQQFEQQSQDSNVDASLPSDTNQRSNDVQYSNRRGGGSGGRQQQQQQQWDVGNWNGETLIYSRSAKDDEKALDSDTNNASNTSHALSRIPNGQSSLSGVSTVNNVSELSTQQKSKADFDPVEAARQIKNVIGIGQSQQQNSRTPQPLMDLKPFMGDQQAAQRQQKSNTAPSRSFDQNLNIKTSPPPLQRIPQQPVIFSDRFDGGMNKIDVQFGNLGETLEDASSKNVSIPISSSASSYASYQRSEPIPSLTKQNSALSSAPNLQRTTAAAQHQPSEQSSFVSSNSHTNSTRPSEQQQQPVINQQRVLPPQMQQQQQQPSMTMKPAVPPQYAVHHQQHQMSAPNLLLHSLLYQPQQQQQEPVSLDANYDPTTFQMPPDFSAQYFMTAPMNQQQPTQPRYIVSHPPSLGQQQHQQQQASSNRQQPSSNVQTGSLSTSSSSVAPLSTGNTTTTAPKKGPAVPPGIVVPTALSGQPPYSAAYSTAYGVPPPASGQQQTGASAYSAPYDAEHLFTNSFMQLTNPQQAQSPSGAYGSVTPPVQQQNQQQQHQHQAHANNDNKTMSYRPPITENMLLLQQYQQFAIQQSNNQQQGQQAAAHSPAQLSYFVGHPASGTNYSPGPQIMYAQPAATLAHQQQQASKQQGQHYNQNNSSSGMGGTDDYYGRGSSSSSSNKEAPYMYAVPAQPQQLPPQSVGQQQGLNKQQQQRASNNVYNNQQNQQRPFQ